MNIPNALAWSWAPEKTKAVWKQSCLGETVTSLKKKNYKVKNQIVLDGGFH